jgi:propionate CoA-transferase
MTQRAAKPAEADAVAAMIADGATVALSGNGGGLGEADALYAAVERRFLATGHPRGLTLVHALGIGDAKTRGVNRFAHEGLVARVIGGHWTWSPRMQALAEAEAIEAWTLPAGAIMLLLREIGAGRPGLITHVGLGTFADPLHGGGAANGRARASGTMPVERIEIDGRALLRYKPFPVDVALGRGSLADDAGNVSTVHEAADLDLLAASLAAHSSGGRVAVQVARVVPRGTIPARQVTLPGVLVDSIVHVPEQPQSYLGGYDTELSGEAGGRPRRAPVAPPTGVRGIIARRAADEIRPGSSINFGFGIPGAIPGILAARGVLDSLWVTVEQGIHNGDLLDGAMFGAARFPEAIVSSTRQFDFYSGGGIDIACLGMGELDAAGNVNVSRLGSKVVGPGGFVDIAQNARKLVFCGTFDGKGTEYGFADGRLTLRRAGDLPKLVADVREITFSSEVARARGQEVIYVTERAVFRLAADGVELIELAPGLDLERDVLARAGFRPLLREAPTPMPARHFEAV